MPRFFPLTQTFFGLTHNYKSIVIEEIYACVKHCGFSRSDVLEMPVHERRYHLKLFINENTKKQEYLQEQQQQSVKSTGKGTRSSIVSGDALKSQLRSGKIPNQ